MRIIDSHTGGEPTRAIVEGGPDLGKGSLFEKREVFAERFDHIRTALVNEPRGSDVMVGALITDPEKSSSAAGVIFFNNTGYLNMCGHGAIGVAVTLYYIGRIGLGRHDIDTPVGTITVNLIEPNCVEIDNVESYRYRKSVTVKLKNRLVTGDVAWGGNWFYLTEDHGMSIQQKNISELMLVSNEIKLALVKQGITGNNGAEIDHIELIETIKDNEAIDSRNFVLCPGNEYDRSPCGTGTSAKLACLAADGKLKPEQVFRQQSVIGSVFSGWYKKRKNTKLTGVPAIKQAILPSIRGEAYISLDAQVVVQEKDMYRFGI